MSIKNQNRLPIFALLIIGVTVLSLVGLNFLVDKIATIKPPKLAMKRAQPSSEPQGFDDSLPNQKQAKTPPPNIPPQEQLKRLPPTLEKNGALKRVRNNNEQASEAQRRPDERKNDKVERSSPPPDNNAYGYPPIPESLDPAERALIEQEMERRRDMMRDYGPPPGYYPEPDSLEDSYDPDYDNDYDDPDFEGRREDTLKKNLKTSEYEDREYEDYAGEDNPDYLLNDEYLEEYLREDTFRDEQEEP